MTYNSKAEIEAEITKLQKLLSDFREELDYEALLAAVQAYYDAEAGFDAVCENPLDGVVRKTAAALLAAYPHLKACHEGLEPEWIEWGPDSEGYPNRPVPAGVWCEVKFRYGHANPYHKSGDWYWKHVGEDSDIIAYRIIPAGDA